jgi:hypothetical protein
MISTNVVIGSLFAQADKRRQEQERAYPDEDHRRSPVVGHVPEKFGCHRGVTVFFGMALKFIPDKLLLPCCWFNLSSLLPSMTAS